MNCEEVMELMQRHVDGDLDPQETTRMWDHVSQCPDCAAMLHRLVQLSRGLEQLPRVVPPYSLVDAILPQLADDEAAGMETIAEPYPLGRRARTGGRARREWIGRLAAVLSVAVVVGLMLISGPSLLRLGSTPSHQDAALAPEANQEAAAPKAKASTTDRVTSATARAIQPRTQAGGGSSDVTKDLAPSPSAQGGSGLGGGSADSGAAAGSGSAPAEPSAPAVREHDMVPPTPPASDSGAKGIAPPASPSASVEPPVSIMEAPADEEVLSPDGQWKAVIRQGQFQLVNAGDGAIVHESAAGDGTRTGLVWTDDSSAVHYWHTDAEGNMTKKSFVIAEMKEQTSP